MSREHILSVKYRNRKVKLAKVFMQQASLDRLRKHLLNSKSGICREWVPCEVPEYVGLSRSFSSQTSFALEVNSVVQSIAYGYRTLVKNPEWAKQEVKLNSPVAGCHQMLLKFHCDSGTSTRYDESSFCDVECVHEVIIFKYIVNRKANITKNDAHCGNLIGASRLEIVSRVQFISRVGESHEDAMSNMRHVSDWMEQNEKKPFEFVVYPGSLNEQNVGDDFSAAGDGIEAERVTVDPYLNGDLRGLHYCHGALQPGARRCCLMGDYNDTNMGDPWVWIFVDKHNINDEGREDFLKIMTEEVKPYVLAHERYGVLFDGNDKSIMDQCLNFWDWETYCSFNTNMADFLRRELRKLHLSCGDDENPWAVSCLVPL